MEVDDIEVRLQQGIGRSYSTSWEGVWKIAYCVSIQYVAEVE
jgi:hypothetical protein